MTYPLVTELADDGVPVAVTCRVLDLSRDDLRGALAPWLWSSVTPRTRRPSRVTAAPTVTPRRRGRRRLADHCDGACGIEGEPGRPGKPAGAAGAVTGTHHSPRGSHPAPAFGLPAARLRPGWAPSHGKGPMNPDQPIG